MIYVMFSPRIFPFDYIYSEPRGLSLFFVVFDLNEHCSSHFNAASFSRARQPASQPLFPDRERACTDNRPVTFLAADENISIRLCLNDRCALRCDYALPFFCQRHVFSNQFVDSIRTKNTRQIVAITGISSWPGS